jgi:hypothetical protein
MLPHHERNPSLILRISTLLENENSSGPAMFFIFDSLFCLHLYPPLRDELSTESCLASLVVVGIVVSFRGTTGFRGSSLGSSSSC